MSVTPKAGDLGIILSKTGDASGAYVDISGTTQQSTAITGSYTAQGDAAVGGRYFSIIHGGASSALSLFVTVNLAVATDMTVKLQVRYGDAEPWCDIQSVNEATGTTSVEHTLTAGSVCIQTASHQATGQCRVMAKATAGGAMTANDFILVKARVA